MYIFLLTRDSVDTPLQFLLWAVDSGKECICFIFGSVKYIDTVNPAKILSWPTDSFQNHIHSVNVQSTPGKSSCTLATSFLEMPNTFWFKWWDWKKEPWQMQNKMACDIFFYLLGSLYKLLNEERDHLDLISNCWRFKYCCTQVIFYENWFEGACI